LIFVLLTPSSKLHQIKYYINIIIIIVIIIIILVVVVVVVIDVMHHCVPLMFLLPQCGDVPLQRAGRRSVEARAKRCCSGLPCQQ
jgi:hypothetical protein